MIASALDTLSEAQVAIRDHNAKHGAKVEKDTAAMRSTVAELGPRVDAVADAVRDALMGFRISYDQLLAKANESAKGMSRVGEAVKEEVREATKNRIKYDVKAEEQDLVPAARWYEMPLAMIRHAARRGWPFAATFVFKFLLTVLGGRTIVDAMMDAWYSITIHRGS